MKTLLIQIKSLVVVMLMLSATTLLAQKAETPDNSYDFGAKINDMTITEGGTVVVATNDGLVGIKPGQDGLLFNFTDYGRVKPEELKFIPRAPYVVVGQTGFGGLQTKSAVIDYMSGKTVFSTEKNGWKAIGMSQVLMPQNKLIVSGQRRAKEKYAQAVAIYDLNTGDQVSFYKFKGSRQAMGTPLVLSDGVIIPTTKGLMKVDMTSGNVLWENELKNVAWMVADETEKEIYAFTGSANGKNTKIYKINANGSSAWADERKVKGSISNFQILPQGIAVVSDVASSGKKGLAKLAASKAESKITMLSAANGEDLWEKAPKTKGYVQHFYVMDDGILFGIKEGGINKISYDGKTLFKKPLKTGENILTMAETSQGLIYITSEDANIVDLNTGDQVWKKPLKFKRADVVSSDYDKKNNRFLIAADEVLFSIDANTGTSEILTEADFEGKENPTSVEVRDGGVLLASDQNMMFLDWNGDASWHEYKRAPGKSAFGAILAGVTAVATAAASASAAYEAGKERNYLGQYTARGDRLNNLSKGMAAASGASVAEMLKRFKATSATKDAQFILTKLDDGIGLVKLNKDTGTVEKEIVLKDKKPAYKVDEFGGYLYYKPNDKTIYAYNLNN
ncbi:outer membrane protein assembly factor BamB family protein [Ichthyenterobacterium magnum]|uniref:Putative pyrroloquinoline-quinone binding quinoprotein n=1 Tax=Ichthyenterobacterium magnum TaxID=1230530 RepID=A0A420DVH2_9FLAO|nr:PQQ-binding-like beta-propeller repeat protein [Ichthyenterobacterium magnum]RKE98217.1 putative pyrroloquinoline-quinone binding quinoprotein [Ichthyenterobacterium magnum]